MEPPRRWVESPGGGTPWDLYQQGFSLQLGNLGVPFPATMLGSRVCWQLLLGWALLLGQPVFGDSGSSSSEERSLQEPAESVAEGPELEEQEDQLPELEEMGVPQLVQEEPEEEKPPSDEELEEMGKEEREWLEQEKEKPCGSWLQYLQSIALGRYNKEQNEYYKQHGDATLRTKKAIGSMVSLKVVLVKTNCTNVMRRGGSVFFMHRYYQSLANCESLKGSEKECTFTLFDDERKSLILSMPVVAEKCNPMPPVTKVKRHRRPIVGFRS